MLTAALGIGATSAVFSLVNAVLVRPLPYPSPDRLLLLMTTWRGRLSVPGLSAPEFFAWRRTADAVERSAAYRIGGVMTLDRDGLVEQIGTGRVSAEFFLLFGARARRGRTFTQDEDRPRGAAVVVSESLRKVAALSGVDGAAVTLTGAPLSGVTSFLNMTVPGRSLGGPYFIGGYLGGSATCVTLDSNGRRVLPRTCRSRRCRGINCRCCWGTAAA